MSAPISSSPLPADCDWMQGPIYCKTFVKQIHDMKASRVVFPKACYVLSVVEDDGRAAGKLRWNQLSSTIDWIRWRWG